MPKKGYRIISKPNAVRRKRIVLGQDMDTVAEAAGISRTTLSVVENGGGTSMGVAHRIAKHFEVGFEELFEVVSSPTKKAAPTN